ncbi:unnamed protein product [Mucor hiemalis]
MSGQVPPIAPSSTNNAQSNINNMAAGAINLFRNKANYYLTSLDKELAKQPYCNDVERRTGVPKSYLVLGTSTALFMLIFFNLGAQLLTNAIAWVYPAYASFKAIESPSTDDDTQWLTYWTVIGFFQMIEYFSDILLFWFPFYYTFKTLIILWLLLPQFRGAEIAYVRFVRPFLLRAQPEIERRTNKITNSINQATFGQKAE